MSTQINKKHVVLLDPVLGSIGFMLSLPDPLPARKLPLVVVLGGLGTMAVSYETVRRWVNHFGPTIAADLRKRRLKPHTSQQVLRQCPPLSKAGHDARGQSRRPRVAQACFKRCEVVLNLLLGRLAGARSGGIQSQRKRACLRRSLLEQCLALNSAWSKRKVRYCVLRDALLARRQMPASVKGFGRRPFCGRCYKRWGRRSKACYENRIAGENDMHDAHSSGVRQSFSRHYGAPAGAGWLPRRKPRGGLGLFFERDYGDLRIADRWRAGRRQPGILGVLVGSGDGGCLRWRRRAGAKRSHRSREDWRARARTRSCTHCQRAVRKTLSTPRASKMTTVIGANDLSRAYARAAVKTG